VEPEVDTARAGEKREPQVSGDNEDSTRSTGSWQQRERDHAIDGDRKKGVARGKRVIQVESGCRRRPRTMRCQFEQIH
jgi:hypothetical protein